MQHRKFDQAHWKQHAPGFPQLSLASLRYFRPNPFAVHAVRRQDEKQPVVQAYCFIDLVVDFLPAGNLVRSEPAAHSVVLKVGMETTSEFLILRRVADEARIKLNGLMKERRQIFNE